ncbi:MAG: molecular chaperone [Cyanobacteria bacterium QH_8_48_120]|nr:MAG: molecular chaperone [Cyanobacteria bacterium QH_1_48_107]PSO53434.1 MAG: molecular chaperone [Cyanobacteria bacterium QH_10_48_56]PSO61116.1 MAG: molecular chaperone [Cyanobacteria bacterium QH_2_48_84]PSO61588.1 MAG: molecular chaperone [Cyanobacteria bacterium QH_6_48_35]PSO66913.1 MAG: molecular chaperone [Cyanobacteria bacterium QH_7_48_89]PSO70861.1 MAG: molecular chaperone [Cyanobacteria bacterium QH_8_48_120]PSO71044.1 MAG: molecular chaperone [Cyanobacteria bacterium QS_1_48_3
MAIVPRRSFGGMQPYRGSDPFGKMNALQQEMNRMFSDLIGGDGEEVGMTFAPAAEVEETDDAVHLRLEVPGMQPDDFDIQVGEDSVSITGERKSQFQSEDRSRSEFRYGRFQRVIPLSAEVQTDQVQAEYKNGVLHLNMPKSQEEKKRSVKVNVS